MDSTNRNVFLVIFQIFPNIDIRLSVDVSAHFQKILDDLTEDFQSIVMYMYMTFTFDQHSTTTLKC